ncbi:MAG: hypothetical protein IJM96_08565, partial [Clostridia bacterium]|nr:hypothetical protein [Clostridia bacterium]
MSKKSIFDDLIEEEIRGLKTFAEKPSKSKSSGKTTKKTNDKKASSGKKSKKTLAEEIFSEAKNFMSIGESKKSAKKSD